MNNPNDPLFDLLGDGPAIDASPSHKQALRERLMDFPSLAGLITFRLPVIGRVFIPRIASVLGLLAIGAGLSAFVAIWPFEREPAGEPESAQVQTETHTDAGAETHALEASAMQGDEPEADGGLELRAIERGAELSAFDPPRAPVLPASDGPDIGDVAPSSAVIAVAATPAPPPTQLPVQAPQPEPEKKRSQPAAPPTPTSTEVAAQPGGIVIPPTSTPQPTAEGRPTLPPLSTVTPPPTKTPEPPPTPVP